jgi:hypothetical protein
MEKEIMEKRVGNAVPSQAVRIYKDGSKNITKGTLTFTLERANE